MTERDEMCKQIDALEAEVAGLRLESKGRKFLLDEALSIMRRLVPENERLKRRAGNEDEQVA